ncbi:hypothetical protein C8R41DRAFT_844678, partial [Lentinula lateritia]
MRGCVLLPLFFLMLLTIGGQTCVATKDCSIYYSVLSRSFVRHFLGNSPNDNISALVNIQHSNFAFTSWVDFVVLDELVGCEATFGLQFRQTCSFLQCLGLFELLPVTKTSLEHCVPLPRLPSVIGLPGSSAMLPDGVGPLFPLLSNPKTTRNMAVLSTHDGEGFFAAPNNGNNNCLPSTSSTADLPSTSIPSAQLLDLCLFGNSKSGILSLCQ